MDNDHTGQLIFCGDSQVCILIVYLYQLYRSWTDIGEIWLILRDPSTASVSTPDQGPYPGLIAIVIAANANLQSQLCSTVPSHFWHGDLFCLYVLKMEAYHSSGLYHFNICLESLLLGWLYCSKTPMSFPVALLWRSRVIWLFVVHSNWLPAYTASVLAFVRCFP